MDDEFRRERADPDEPLPKKQNMPPFDPDSAPMPAKIVAGITFCLFALVIIIALGTAVIAALKIFLWMLTL